MYDLSGLADDLMVSGKEAAAVGGSALVGAGIAQAVIKYSATLGQVRVDGTGAADPKGSFPTPDANGKYPNKPGTPAGQTDENKPMLPAWVPPLLPIAVGVAVHNYGKSKFPLAAPGVAAGMVAVGLGKLIGVIVGPSKAAGDTGEFVSKNVPFSTLKGLGADVYDYSLMGFGIGPGDVSAYMRLGSSPFTSTPAAGTSIMSPGAPVQITTLKGLGAGAPTQVQVISTTPSMSAALVG